MPTRETLSDTSYIVRNPDTYEPSMLARAAQWCVKHLMPLIALLVTVTVMLFIHFDGKPANKAKHEKQITQPNNTTSIHNESPQSK